MNAARSENKLALRFPFQCPNQRDKLHMSLQLHFFLVPQVVHQRFSNEPTKEMNWTTSEHLRLSPTPSSADLGSRTGSRWIWGWTKKGELVEYTWHTWAPIYTTQYNSTKLTWLVELTILRFKHLLFEHARFLFAEFARPRALVKIVETEWNICCATAWDHFWLDGLKLEVEKILRGHQVQTGHNFTGQGFQGKLDLNHLESNILRPKRFTAN